MGVFTCCLYYVPNIQRTGTHICRPIIDMGVTFGLFWHIIIIKDAAPISLESLRQKLLTSLESEY